MTRILASILMLITPLKLELGWLADKVAVTKKELIGHSSAFTSLCITIAAVILAFKMLKMYYSIASDEQNGGFGGVSLKEIFRPLLIFFLLFNIGPLMNLVDTSVNYVAAAASGIVSVETNVDFSALSDDLDQRKKTDDDDLNEWREELRKTYAENATLKEAVKTVREYEDELYDYNGIDMQKVGRDSSTIMTEFFDGRGKFKSYMGRGYIEDSSGSTEISGKRWRSFSKADKRVEGSGMTAEAIQSYNKAIQKINEIQSEYQSGLKDLKKANKKAKRGIGLVNKIVSFIFTMGAGLILGFGEIMLAMFGMFAPLVLTLSLIDRWKDAFWGLIAKYLEISMWKPIALCMIHIITTARQTLNKEFAVQLVTGAFSVASGDSVGDALMNRTISGAGVAIGNIMICLIGIFAILKVPSIATQVMNLGTGGAGGEMAAAGAAMGSMAGGMVKKGAGAVAKGGAALGVGAAAGFVSNGGLSKGGFKQGIAGMRSGLSNVAQGLGNNILSNVTGGVVGKTQYGMKGSSEISLDSFKRGSNQEKSALQSSAASRMSKSRAHAAGRRNGSGGSSSYGIDDVPE